SISRPTLPVAPTTATLKPMPKLQISRRRRPLPLPGCGSRREGPAVQRPRGGAQLAPCDGQTEQTRLKCVESLDTLRIVRPVVTLSGTRNLVRAPLLVGAKMLLRSLVSGVCALTAGAFVL